MGRTRIETAFSKARGEHRAVLVTYLMAGDPDLETSYQALCALRDNGADIIELGAPFTDPMADGIAIQKAGLRSLAAGTRLTDVIALAARFRKDDQTTPLILMGYANPVHSMGYVRFAEAAAKAGIDGSILVDLPPEEDAPLREIYAKYDLSVIRLATPTTNEARAAKVAEGASGFIYFVAVTGVTGAGSADPAAIAGQVAMVRKVSGLPVCVGFGVKSGAQAAEMAKIADGVVVGSAFVEKAGDAQASGRFGDAAPAMGRLVRELRSAVDSVHKA
ncbi:MAG: tryptophan synthase subunit alpha [Hyphomonas sp.]|uniref:tryptophan synthase subunit alpha n=1 Tax=Hyphomonas sp. TaxID=87 RepID=UPI00185825C1|nr:tryptophan synthase subunit alpha [Hyphomonas sp.]MBA3068976.1 tryptophan synthase subunit alpha [Hyphomonas sp.]MBU3919856.1 tryptophan synthase subunit alpha [Alphaproteobacteria bacterium]MBU4061609.1 tryptophan synthase subunit alpha [Alphaproteobacteria bacterium]MBU4163454.1 tryptophan synthase subunit alpha [Alphaproteobacteria bacterium]